MKPILSQAVLDTPWKYFPPWLFGFIGFLSVVLLGLMVIYYMRKVFGRKPPIAEEMKGIVKLLRGEIHREKNSVLKEVGLRLSPLVDRVQKNEDAIEEIQLDRTRKWEALTRSINEVANNVAFLRGQRKGEE